MQPGMEGGGAGLLCCIVEFRQCRARCFVFVASLHMKCPQAFGFYIVAENMCMDPVLVASAPYRVTEIDWLLSGGSDDFVA